jgi:hypothetical protein
VAFFGFLIIKPLIRLLFTFLFSSLATATVFDIAPYSFPHAWPPISQSNEVIGLLNAGMGNVSSAIYRIMVLSDDFADQGRRYYQLMASVRSPFIQETIVILQELGLTAVRTGILLRTKRHLPARGGRFLCPGLTLASCLTEPCYFFSLVACSR